MRAVVLMSALWAALALATPTVNKRAVVTKWHTEVVTEVVTVQAQRTRYRPHGGSPRQRTRTVTLQQPQPESSTVVVDEPEGQETRTDPTPTVEPSSSQVSVRVTVTDEPASPTPTPTEEPEEPAVQPQPQPEPEPEPEETDTAATPPGPGSSYRDRVLFHHNQHRANHSAPPMEWDDGLESAARQLANSCIHDHNTEIGGGGYGQNIASGNPAENIGKIISDQFYNGELHLYPGYGIEPPMDNFRRWGHFSQVVWVDSTRVACATAPCNNKPFTVCNYKSPGNFGGRYAKNVLPPKGAPVLRG